MAFQALASRWNFSGSRASFQSPWQRFLLCLGAISFFAVASAGQQTALGSARIFLDRGIPLTQVMVDGAGPFTFVVDTGTSSEAIFSLALAQRLGLPTTGQKMLTDLSGERNRVVDSVVVDSLTVAGVEFNAVPAIVNELPGEDRAYAGILGFKLFHDLLLTLDFPRQTMTLSRGSLAADRPGTLPYQIPRGIPMVMLTIDGQQMEAGVDSGGLGLTVPESMAQTLKFKGKVEAIAQGKTQVSSFLVRGAVIDGDIELAGYHFDKPFVEISSGFQVANIGSVALRDFAVTFDQRTRLVQFAASPKSHHLAKPLKGVELQAVPGEVLTDAIMRKH